MGLMKKTAVPIGERNGERVREFEWTVLYLRGLALRGAIKGSHFGRVNQVPLGASA